MLRKETTSVRWFTVKALCSGFVYSFVLCLFNFVLRELYSEYISTSYWCVFCGSITYDPHKSSSLRDPAAQTADGEVQSAGPPLILSSAITPLGVTTAWAQAKLAVWSGKKKILHTAVLCYVFIYVQIKN